MLCTDLSSFGSLKMADGCGCVINGEPRQLRALAQHWEKLKQRVQSSGKHSQNNAVYKTQTDGVLLQGKVSYKLLNPGLFVLLIDSLCSDFFY